MKKTLITTAVAALIGATPAFAQTPEWDTWSDTWVCWDDLGRTVASSDEGVTRKEKDPDTTVGMFYYLWHGFEKMTTKDVSKIVAENPENPDWGPEGYFHWGSTPWLGMYSAGSPYVIQKHLQMLCDAGVDFLFFDCTNGNAYLPQVQKVLDECKRRDALGMKYPTLTFMLHYEPITSLATSIYNRFFKTHPEDIKYFFHYEGKPLMLAKKESIAKDDVKDFFTWRYSWAWLRGNTNGGWSWLEYYPQAMGWSYVYDEDLGRSIRIDEQMSVSVAQHATTKVGKSYSHGSQPTIDKYGMCEETPYGRYFQEQWNQAISKHPPLVMVTQFNEWIAQRFIIRSQSEFSNVRPGATAKIGESYFVDVYNPEFSRDLEPSRHPSVRDNYYLQLVSNVRKYRGVRPIPTPKESLTIDIDGPMDQWDAVSVEYRDDRRDCEYISLNAQAEETFDYDTNDIVRTKVTKDSDYLYFYVETSDPITDINQSSLSWMRLLLCTEGSQQSGWKGYNYAVMKDSKTGRYMLHHPLDRNDWRWEPMCEIPWRVEGNKLHLAIDRSRIQLYNRETDIDFKWSDNTREVLDDIMHFISEGDSAPNGRFNYRFKGSKLASQPHYSNLEAALASHTEVEVTRAGIEFNFVNNRGNVEIAVYTPSGALVATAASRGQSNVHVPLQPGYYVTTWRSAADSGSQSLIIK